VHTGVGTGRAALSVALWQVAGLSALGVAGAIALIHAGPYSDVGVAYGYPVVAALYALGGLVAWWRRPDNAVGPLLTMTAWSFIVAGLQNTGLASLIAAGFVTTLLPLALLTHVLHVYPSGRIESRFSRVTVIGSYAAALLAPVPLWAFTPAPPPYDLLLVSPRPDLAAAGEHLQTVVGAVSILATTWVLVRRLRAFSRGPRRVLAPVLAYGVLAVAAPSLAANLLEGLLDDPVAELTVVLVVLGGVPVLLVSAILRGGFAATGSLGDLVTSVASTSATTDLDDALRRTLGDPSAALLRWVPDLGVYADADGREADLPAADDVRAVVPIELSGRRIGAVLYDPVLSPEPAAVAAVAPVVGIAVERERLAAEVSASRQALAAASSRLLDEIDRERRRIARDLHDGLQVSLVRLSMQAHQLAADELDDDTRPALARLATEVDTTAADLRDLVQGVMPALLVERGLEDAVRELVLSLPLRVEVEAAGLDGRLRPELESTAYFVVAEALTNVVKHAAASKTTVALRREDGVLVIEVDDDGVGVDRESGAPGGTGLRGLRDRLDVLGGSLDVTGSDAGTRLVAVVPCA
jgi:signal transduction histidine kinase